MSIINIVKDHYESIPDWMIKLMGASYYCLPEGIRYGKNYSDTWRLLKETERLSRDEIDEMVNRRFVETVRHAYAQVPFYQERYDEYGVDIETIKDLRDIMKLPTVCKEDVQRFGKKMIAKDSDPSHLMYITTSGSTGNPVGFYQAKSMVMTEWAYTMHIWGRVGCTVNSSRLVLRGKKIHSGGAAPDVFYDPLRRELSVNIFNMTEETMERYCIAIEKYKPEFIHGYMSAIVMLTKYIVSRPGGLNHHFKGILATSETIIPEQKAFVERALGARVFSFYGHSERLVIAGECEDSADYHVEPLYGYCELLDGQGNPAQEGEIVGTGFLNPAMPLIRYRTGDLSCWSQESKCCCGRSHKRLAGVHGRNQDMLVNQDGAYVSLTAINIHSNEFDKIIRYKFIQDMPGVVTMKILPKAGFSARDAETIEKLLIQKTGGKIRFCIELVDELPVKKNGKYQIIEQSLKIDLK